MTAKHSTLRSVLNQLGRDFIKVTARHRTTAHMEIKFIATVAPEFLCRPALVASTLDGETLVLVQSMEPGKWQVYARFVTFLPSTLQSQSVPR